MFPFAFGCEQIKDINGNQISTHIPWDQSSSVYIDKSVLSYESHWMAHKSKGEIMEIVKYD